MKRKEHLIKARVSAQTKQLFSRIAKREGLNISKLLRTLIHNYERPFTLTDDQMDMLRYHFTNTARLGGLLNQIAYNLNSDNLRIINGKSNTMEIDASELKTLCHDLEDEVQRLKSQIATMCKDHQVVS